MGRIVKPPERGGQKKKSRKPTVAVGTRRGNPSGIPGRHKKKAKKTAAKRNR